MLSSIGGSLHLWGQVSSCQAKSTGATQACQTIQRVTARTKSETPQLRTLVTPDHPWQRRSPGGKQPGLQLCVCQGWWRTHDTPTLFFALSTVYSPCSEKSRLSLRGGGPGLWTPQRPAPASPPPRPKGIRIKLGEGHHQAGKVALLGNERATELGDSCQAHYTALQRRAFNSIRQRETATVHACQSSSHRLRLGAWPIVGDRKEGIVRSAWQAQAATMRWIFPVRLA
jgi:hypothetical protein